MTRRSTSPKVPMPPGPYRLEYAVRVWKQLLVLSADEIALLGRELEQLAARPPDTQGPGAVSHNLHVADLAVSYEVSGSRQVLTVLGVARREEKAD